MATTVAPGEYTLVYLVYNTISNLLTQSEQVACFRNAARHLTPGGRFVIELWVPELRWLPPGQPATVFASEPGYIGLDTYDPLRQHVVSHHFRFDDSRQARLYRSPHRYIWLSRAGPHGPARRPRTREQARRLAGHGVHRRIAVARLRLPQTLTTARSGPDARVPAHDLREALGTDRPRYLHARCRRHRVRARPRVPAPVGHHR
nr:hypothetical protein GCM10020092_069330 [Actinoplanes digitatis]